MPTDINLESTSTPVSYDGVGASARITARTWGSPNGARAAVLLVHGLGAHSGWFEAFASRLAQHKIFVLSYDQVGFGKRRSEEFTSRQQWLDDVKVSFEYLQNCVGNIPIYVMGNSMGAVVALRAAPQLEPAGIAMFSPGFDGHPQTFSLPYKLKAVVTAFLAPQTELTLPYTVDDITASVKVREWLLEDPDRRFCITAKMGLELLKLTIDAKAQAKMVPCPVFMATAQIEKIVNNPVSNKVFDQLQAPSKTRMHFQESWHDLMFDPFLDKLTAGVTDWMQEVALAPVG
jgi:alpha-beta hydrolase superfamily lysophospholipase